MNRIFLWLSVLSVVYCRCVSPVEEHRSFFELASSSSVETPKTVEALVALVKKAGSEGRKVAIVGAGKSMGGQTIGGSDDSYRISLERLNKVINLNFERKEITIQAGMTWRELQEEICPHRFAVKSMQSYSDFSIGGSLGVNVHGQDIHAGMLIETVQSFHLLLPCGDIVRVSRQENEELFGLAIGGYGLFGIIVDVTLLLTDDVVLERKVKAMRAINVGEYFKNRVQNNPNVEFYSARFSVGKHDLLEKALVVTYEKTERAQRKGFALFPSIGEHMMGALFRWMCRLPLLRNLRFALEAVYLRMPQVTSRHEFMAHSIASLPQDDETKRYILQEYFIPYAELNTFIDRLRTIAQEYNVDLLNVTARHIEANEESVLSWAPQESCALVLYITQQRTDEAYENTVAWTRRLIDEALALNGTFYLPYHFIATPDQVKKAYKNAPQFIALKEKYDPQLLFVNKTYQHYLQGIEAL